MPRSTTFIVMILCFALAAPAVADDGSKAIIEQPTFSAGGVGEAKVSATPPLDNRWTFSALMNYVGSTRMVAGDIDNDGRPELVLGGYSSGSWGSNSYIAVLRYRPSSQDYFVAEISEYIPEGISTLSAFDADGDDIWEIYVGLKGGGVRIFNGDGLEPLPELVTTATEINRILFADGDNDIYPEVVVIGASTTELFHRSTHDLENLIAFGADDAEVGNVDLSPGNEIIYSDGSVIRIISFDTADLLWTQPDGFDGDLLDLGNIDLDPALEILSGGSRGVTAYDYGVDVAKWNIDDDALDSMMVTDVTGDGVPEIIAGNNQWGDIYCYDAQTRAALWSIDNPEHGTTDVGVFDLDLDGQLEVYWGAGATSTGDDFLFIHDVASQVREWRSTDLDGPFLGVDFGDVDDDGDVEVVFASRGSQSGDNGLIYVFDATFHQLEWKSERSSIPSSTWHGVNDIDIADVDDDNETEIVVGTSSTHDGAIHVLNGTTHEVEASYIEDSWAPFYSVVVTDVDKDGDTEIVALSSSQVIVLDGSDGTEEWRTTIQGYGVSQLAVADVDGDTVPEIVVIDEDLHIFDGISHDGWQSDADEFTALDLFDLGGNGAFQIVLGTDDGDLVTYDWIGNEWIETSRYTVSDVEIDSVHGYRDLANRTIIAFGSDYRLSGFHYQQEAILWQSEPLAAAVGTGNGIKARPIPDFTGVSLLVGTSHSALQFGGVVEPPMPQLTTSSPVVDEDAGSISFTVQRAGSSGGMLTVEYATSNGTAESGVDYTAEADLLSWNNGDASDRVVQVSITDDEEMEGDETFNFTLSNVTGGVLGSPSLASATIIDDDVSYLQMSSGSLNVSEDGAQVQLTVTRTGGSDFPVSVQFATVDDTAVGGDDFTAAAGTLDWAAEDMMAKIIVIPITNDDLTEGTESFTVNLSSPGVATLLGNPTTTTVSILDDDIANLALSSATFAVNERDGVLSVTVNRSLSTVDAVSVDYQTSNGSATAGQDYNAMSGTLNWGDGDGEPKSFSITVYEDQDVENTETVNITLSNPTGPAAVVIPDSAVLSIADNDASAIRFANADFSAVEDDGSVDITVMRVGGDTGAVTVDYATASGGATLDEDYEASSGTLSWGDGEDENKIFTITLLDDGLVESNETVLLSLANATGNASLGNPYDSTLTIFDDETLEDQINTTVANIQTFPRSAQNSQGDGVIVWESQGQDGWGLGVYGRRINGVGEFLGGEFQVNQTTDEDQQKASVAVANDGSFVVVWQAAAAGGTEIMARRFDAAGSPLSDEFVVNSSPSGSQSAPKVAVDSSNRFMVVWQGSDVSGSGVFARLIDAGGIPEGDEFAVNTTTPQSQDTPHVDGSPDEGFVVVWESYSQDDGYSESVIVRRYSSQGAPLGGELIVNNVIVGDQKKPSVAVVGGGGFLVVWEDATGQDGSGYSVRGRWFNSSGAATGSEFTVNSFTDGNQRNPTAAAEYYGRAAVLWESYGQDGSGSGVYGRLLEDDGTMASQEIAFNSYTEGAQYRPSVACSASGAFLAVWASVAQDQATEGVFGSVRQLHAGPIILRDGFESGDVTVWTAAAP